MRAAAASTFDGGKRGGLALPSPRCDGVVDHMAAEHHDVGRLRALFRRVAEERRELLLGAVDHGGAASLTISSPKFELPEEVDLLARGVERKPVAVGDGQSRRF